MINPLVTTDTLTSAADTVELDLTYTDNIAIQITGTWVGTITFQGSNDGTNFVSTVAKESTNASLAALTATTTANGMFYMGTNLFHPRLLRVTMTSFTSGTATVNILTTSIQR